MFVLGRPNLNYFLKQENCELLLSFLLLGIIDSLYIYFSLLDIRARYVNLNLH